MENLVQWLSQNQTSYCRTVLKDDFRVQLNYEILFRKEPNSNLHRQSNLPHAILDLVCRTAVCLGGIRKSIQATSEPYGDSWVIWWILSKDRSKVRKYNSTWLKKLSFENANEDCLAILSTIREREDIMGLSKCWIIEHMACAYALAAYSVQRQAKEN